ncbi:MAG: glycosyltransferase family 2 protein [Phycisphaerae bacterium]
MAEPVATVVIPNYNGMPYLPHLMGSLAAQSDRRLGILVVDDASSDDSVAYLRGQWPDANVIRNERNLGFAGSCNRGLSGAKTPFVVLLNNDTHVDADWLAEGLRPFDADDIGSVASLVLLADGPDRVDTAGDLYSVAGGAVKRGHRLPRGAAEKLPRACFSPSAASAFYRLEALKRVGGLDDRFESYYEDVDLGFRLAWAGYRCVFAPASVCYHHLSASYDPKGWRYHFNSARNAEIVWQAHMPATLRRKYHAAHLLFLLMQAMNKARQGCLRPYLAGKWAVLRHRRHIAEKRAADRRLARVGPRDIEALLVRDWWKLHLAGTRRRLRDSERSR